MVYSVTTHMGSKDELPILTQVVALSRNMSVFYGAQVEADGNSQQLPYPLHKYQNEAGALRNHMCCLGTLTPDAVQWFNG